MMAVLVFILILSFLIFIHELGHFLAAKKSGVIVEEFGIGYPPKAVKLFTWKGTDFTLNWIPFGGFVRMAGEAVEYSEVDTKEDQKKVDEDDIGKFYAATPLQKLLIILAGAGFNFIFGIIAFTFVFSQMGIPEPIETPRIAQVMPDTPAAEAGLPENVEIQEIRIGEQTYVVDTTDEVVAAISSNAGTTATFVTTGECEGFACSDEMQLYEIYLRTAEETPEGEGSIGIVFQPVAFITYEWWQMPYKSAWYGLQQTFFLGELIIHALGDMVGDLVTGGEVPTEVAGPIGIVHQASAAGIFSEGYLTVLSFAAMLSINLAIMNILPIPPLDGGRAVFIILENLISEKYAKPLEYYLNYGGYLLLLLLIVLITARDIWRLFI